MHAYIDTCSDLHFVCVYCSCIKLYMYVFHTTIFVHALYQACYFLQLHVFIIGVLSGLSTQIIDGFILM